MLGESVILNWSSYIASHIFSQTFNKNLKFECSLWRDGPRPSVKRGVEACIFFIHLFHNYLQGLAHILLKEDSFFSVLWLFTTLTIRIPFSENL